MKITKEFLREVVLPYLKKYPRRWRPCAWAAQGGELIMDTELPKLDPSEPPPRELRYDIEHLILMLHPDPIDHNDWNVVYKMIDPIIVGRQAKVSTVIDRLEEYVK